MSTSPAANIDFDDLTATQLCQWVEDHQAHVNDCELCAQTLLYSAVDRDDLALVEWLIDTGGVDVNGRNFSGEGATANQCAKSPAVVRALLERSADPTLLSGDGWTPLMGLIRESPPDCIECLLEDRRVVDSINTVVTSLPLKGDTALHFACRDVSSNQLSILRLLLAAGADSQIRDAQGRTPLQLLREKQPNNTKAIAVFEKELVDVQRAACLVRIRRLVVARRGVTLRNEDEAQVAGGATGDVARMLAYVASVSEGEDGCRKDVFTLVMEIILPTWSPLCKPLGSYKKLEYFPHMYV